MLSEKQGELSMAIDLTEDDHIALDGFLDTILNAYKDGKLTLDEARSHLAQVVAAAAIDNASEVKAYIRLPAEDLSEEN
jgi:hypothetical protein